ncbi:MAG: (d)CMP kinase [Mycoplasmoidaceae bacterium]|nr:MAG: (d)CMP kinase [Mycoplasmoidaceae bacterium]
MSKHYQIAIDGPAGAGKSTIAKELASLLNYTFINSGGIFRSIAVAVVLNNLDINDSKSIVSLLPKIKVTQIGNDMYLNGNNISDKTWTQEITVIVPKIAQIKEVREYTRDVQRKIAENSNIVIEGRDTTTVVFPNATLKCWVFADPIIRATRRWEQTGKKETLELYLKTMLERDKQDSERKIDPMKRATDAYDVDTSTMSIEHATKHILDEFYRRIKR